MSATAALVFLALTTAGQQTAASNTAASTTAASNTAASDTVLVQFHSTHCGPCRAMHPIVQKLASEGYPLQQVDVDQQPQYAQQFQIKSTPTFVIFSRGREAQRIEGPANYGELAGLFQTVGFRPGNQQAAAQPALHTQSAQPTQFTSAPGPQPQASPLRPTQGYVPATANPPAANPASTSVSPQQRAAWATVRLKIEDDRGYSFGTGTIIDRHDDEALVITCGHVFRQSQGKGKIHVDLFAPGATQPVEGQLIAYDLDRDVALLSVRPTVKIDPVPVAPGDYAVAVRDRVFTIGCDKGAAPSLRNSHITSVNKYQGSPNFTAEGTPVDGRSGGGMFSESGYLIGICNAADAQDNEGLYAGLATVHWQLDQIGQSAIYRGQAKPATPAIAAEQPAVARNVAQEAPFPAATLPAMPSTMPPAAASPLPPASDDTEVIVIVRSRSNPTRQSEIFVMDRPPADLIRQLQASGSPAPRGTSQDLLRTATRLGQPGDVGGGAIVRGQSQ